jgi:hypothetical protein
VTPEVGTALDRLVAPRALDGAWALPDGREVPAGAPADVAAAAALLVLEAAAPAEMIAAFAADYARVVAHPLARALLCRATATPGAAVDVLYAAASRGPGPTGELALVELLSRPDEAGLRAACDAARRRLIAALGAPAGMDLLARAAAGDPRVEAVALWRASWQRRHVDRAAGLVASSDVPAQVIALVGRRPAVVPDDVLAQVAALFDGVLDEATRAWLELVAPRSLEVQALVAGCMREHRRRAGVTFGPYRAGGGLMPRIPKIEDNLYRLLRETRGRTRGLHASAALQATHTSNLNLWGDLLLCEDDALAELFVHRLRHDPPRVSTALIHALFDTDGDGERAEPLRRRLAGHPDASIRCTATSTCRSPARRVAERAAQLATIPAEWSVDVVALIKPHPDEPDAATVEPVELPPALSILDALTCGYQHLRTRALLAARKRPELALAFGLGIELDAALVARGYPAAVLGAGMFDLSSVTPEDVRDAHTRLSEPARAARLAGRPADQQLSPALERCLVAGPDEIADRIAIELGATPGPDLEPWLADEAALIAELSPALRRQLWPALGDVTPRT